MPTLIRKSDGKGDGGARCECIAWNEDGTFKKFEGSYPKIGCSMRVGSINSRTYANQDWWMTTRVTEIVEERQGYVKFKTGNSVYELTY